MGHAERKARKRAGIPSPHEPAKRPTRVYTQVEGLGLVTMPEILAGMVIRGSV